jgi:hypothetical protein
MTGAPSFLTPSLVFDKSKPFYSLVVSALAQFHGLIELTSRGLYVRLKNNPGERKDFENHEPPGPIRETVKALLAGGTTVLFGTQKHLAPLAGQTIKVDVNDLGRVIIEDHKPAHEYFDRMSAGSLLILAWELTEPSHTHDPLWEFLRHCRNAAAHRGSFNLLHGEPKRSAKWRGAQIVPSLQGSPLFADPPAPGFMGPGDVLYLLADVEAALL